MEMDSTSANKTMKASLEAGFTIAEFLISAFLFTMVIIGILNLMGVQFLDLNLSKSDLELQHVATSQLEQLKNSTRCVPLDPALQLCAGPDCAALYKEIPVEKQSVTCEWRTYEEPVTSGDRVKTYRIELYTYYTNNPVKLRKYVGTKVCYSN